jgi:hypothetical protein
MDLKTVDNVDKTSRIAIVVSVIWIILAALANNGQYRFDGQTFTIFGVLPVVAYWGFRFIKSAKS